MLPDDRVVMCWLKMADGCTAGMEMAAKMLWMVKMPQMKMTRLKMEPDGKMRWDIVSTDGNTKMSLRATPQVHTRAMPAEVPLHWHPHSLL